jgi:hypothetical protein
MNKILTVLAITAALSTSTALAEDRYRVSIEDGKQRIDFSLNGNDKCVIIDDRIRCQPARKAPARIAATDTH